MTEDGAVLAWGNNGDGQLGVGSDVPESSHPTPRVVFGAGCLNGGGKAAKYALNFRNPQLNSTCI